VSAGTARVAIERVDDVLARGPAEPARWLSTSEQARIAQLRMAARRAHYLAGHWLARELLARHLGGDAGRWHLLERRSQPPAVQGHEAMHVSISHSADWIAVAVADGPVGIDLEARGRVLDAAVESLLRNDGEPGGLDADALLERWVAKEAWLKRNHGSALPARLGNLQLHAVPRDRADVCIDNHAQFHFGYAVARGCAVEWTGETDLVTGAAFAVTELGTL
jgi:4'-phosphopantetheinyl transferase